MVDYRERMGKKSSTSADTGESNTGNGEEEKIIIDVNQLASKVLISSITGVATAIAIKAALGEK
jgi:hypothetical protein